MMMSFWDGIPKIIESKKSWIWGDKYGAKEPNQKHPETHKTCVTLKDFHLYYSQSTALLAQF
jgi:hypothetical protein